MILKIGNKKMSYKIKLSEKSIKILGKMQPGDKYALGKIIKIMR